MLNWDQLCQKGDSVITVVGMAKNVGKTVTLNYVQKNLQQRGCCLGMTSVGRDGERLDALTNMAKPPVHVCPGTVVATAEHAIEYKEAFDVLHRTGIRTPMGEMLVLRAKTDAKILLAGPSKNSEIQKVVPLLWDAGAQSILVDGAFDRQSSTDPMVSRQVILASGATLGRQLHEVINITRCRVEQLTLPEADSKWQRLMDQSDARLVCAKEGRREDIPIKTALLGKEQWRTLLQHDWDMIGIKGGIGDGLAEGLLEKDKLPAVIVEDGSKVFISPEWWRRLRLRQVNFFARKPIELLAVTINPTYPGGKGFEPEELLKEMGRAVSPISVLDVVQGAKYQ